MGSNNEKAVWQEGGTSRIPPRPVLGAALAAKEDEIHKMASRMLFGAFMRGGVERLEFQELMHLVRHLRHLYHEAEELVNPPKEPR